MKRRLFVLVFAPTATLACGLIYDFSYAPSSPPTADDDANVIPSDPIPPEDADFDLVVPASLVLAPGGTEKLPIEIRRKGRFAGRVTVSIVDPIPKGITAMRAAAVEANATTTTLDVAAGPDADARSPGALLLFAASPSVTKQASVALGIRGLPCTLDPSFGTDGKVMLPLVDTTALALGTSLAATDAAIAAFVGDEGGVGVLFFLDLAGKVLASTKAPPAARLGGEPSGGFVILSQGAKSSVLAHRRVDGGVDPAFGVTLPFVSVDHVPLATADGIVVSGFTKSPSATYLGKLGADGAPLAAFGDGGFAMAATATSVDTLGVVPAPNGADIVCGHAGVGLARRAIVTRWSADGRPDPTFGDAGFVTLGPLSRIDECVARDGGFFSVTVDVATVLVGRGFGGGIDDAYGASGNSVALNAFKSVRLDPEGRAVVLATDLHRLLATGSPDTAFADAGTCDLAALGLSTANLITLQSGRVVILAAGTGSATLARLWL